jgi:hypothetical protein
MSASLSLTVTATAGSNSIQVLRLNDPLSTAEETGAAIYRSLTGSEPEIEATGEQSGAEIVVNASIKVGTTLHPFLSKSYALPASITGPLAAVEVLLGVKPNLVIDATVVSA